MVGAAAHLFRAVPGRFLDATVSAWHNSKSQSAGRFGVLPTNQVRRTRGCTLVPVLKECEMTDFPLTAARRMACNANAWREPAQIAMVIRWVEGFIADRPTTPEALAEAKMLLGKLYRAAKEPPVLARG